METGNWIAAWCSRIGSSHVQEDLPCQDATQVAYVSKTNYIVAAVSDGAGSCEHSHMGSRFLADSAVRKLTELVGLKTVDGAHWNITRQEWQTDAFTIFKELKDELRQMGEDRQLPFKSLSATLIVTISNGEFVACANVGDGRATFRDADAIWRSMLNPTKGEEANQTLFVTSDFWDDADSPFFGTYFLREQITAFSMLSDGCERASFEILKYNEDDNRYYDPNIPFKPFFEPNYQHLLRLKGTGNIDQEQLNEQWGVFIDKGNQKLISETDDKSMILSVFIP